MCPLGNEKIGDVCPNREAVTAARSRLRDLVTAVGCPPPPESADEVSSSASCSEIQTWEAFPAVVGTEANVPAGTEDDTVVHPRGIPVPATKRTCPLSGSHSVLEIEGKGLPQGCCVIRRGTGQC